MIKKWISRILSTVAVSIIMLLLLFRLFGYQIYAVVSQSMAPSVPQYRLVFVNPIKEPQAIDFKVDDIVVLKGESIPVLHRIVKIEGDKITTKGDANTALDQETDVSSIKGSYYFSIPLLGLFVIHARLVLIVMLIVFAIIVVKAIKDLKEKEHEK
ncbi:MAG: signal peptidase I [Acholeplasmataceae bacterium]